MSEKTKGDNFDWGDRLESSKKKKEIFDYFPDFHWKFFFSLGSPLKLKKSLEELVDRDKDASLLYSKWFRLSHSGIRPIMQVRSVVDLIFPLVRYYDERAVLEGQLMLCIEREGLRASGVKWHELKYSDDEMSLCEDGEKLSCAYINIDDVGEKIEQGAFCESAVKYLGIWRCYLDARARQVKADSGIELSVKNNERHDKWLYRAIDIWYGWGGYEGKKNNERRSKTKVFGKVADEFNVSRRSIERAINKRFLDAINK